MTMAQNVARIAAAKEDIRQAIIAKGVDVEQTDLIDTYPDKIALISQDTPNIITFERYTERINKRKKSINGSGWQSIVSNAEFVEDSLPIDSRLHNTALLLTTQFKADKDITFNADNLRVIIDLEWLDSNNNVIKTDANIEPAFKMSRKISDVDLYDSVSGTVKQGYFYSAMFGLRIYDIPGWSGVPAGATQLKLKTLRTELVYSGELYLESGAGTMCSVLSNEGHEDPPEPTPPTPQYKRMNFAVKINGNYYKLLNQLGDFLLSQSTADSIFLKTDNNLLCMNIYNNVQQSPSPVFIAYLPGTTQQGYIQINNALTFETIGSYMASYYTYELNFDYENNIIYFNG